MDPLSESLSARISLSEIHDRKYPRPMAGERKRYLLFKSDEYEIVLMIWGPGAMTPIHDHGGSSSIVEIIEGEITERFFDKNGPRLTGETILRAGDRSEMSDGEVIHQMANVTEGFTYTIHQYADPLSLCNFYDQETLDWVKNIPCYDLVNS